MLSIDQFNKLFLWFLIYLEKILIMGKARAIKPIRRRNHANIVKIRKRLQANQELIAKLISEFKWNIQFRN